MPQKALIVVDMLNDFVDEKGALYCGQTARDISLSLEVVSTITEKGETL